jgi:hypothetical protein
MTVTGEGDWPAAADVRKRENAMTLEMLLTSRATFVILSAAKDLNAYLIALQRCFVAALAPSP